MTAMEEKILQDEGVEERLKVQDKLYGLHLKVIKLL